MNKPRQQSAARRPELEIRIPRNQDEFRLANELMAQAYYQNYFDALQRIEMFGTGYPGYRPEHTRIAFWKGEMAGALRVTADAIRIGEARLKMGGLGWVSTAARHRHKGIARELLVDTMGYLRRNRYHVAMLFGIPNFYHRFGFTTTLAEYTTEVDTLEALKLPAGPYRIRPGKPGDIAAIQKIHALEDSATSCSIIRSAAHITNRWAQWKSIRVLTDDRGKLHAYFIPKSTTDGFAVLEVGLTNRDLAPGLLHAVAELAADEMAPRLRFHVPPGHPFVQFLLRLRSRHEARHTQDDGGMMAVVNLGEMLESMLPEWEHQLAVGGLRDLRTELTLLVDRKPIRIRAQRGAIDIAEGSGVNKFGVSNTELLHLISGYRYLEEIMALRRRILSSEARLLLGALFPKRTPFVWHLDRF